jgi:hypothetical protein
MTTSTRSAWGTAVGVLIAIALPISYWIIGLGLEGGSLTDDQARPFADLLGAISPAELLLGPAGIVLVGKSAGVHGAAPWLVLVIASGLALAIVALLGLLTMYAALGSGL